MPKHMKRRGKKVMPIMCSSQKLARKNYFGKKIIKCTKSSPKTSQYSLYHKLFLLKGGWCGFEKHRNVYGKPKTSGEVEVSIKTHLGFKSEYAIKLTFQSSVATSLFFSFVLPLTCFNTNSFEGPFCGPYLHLPYAIVQIRAIASLDLKAENVDSKLKRYNEKPSILILFPQHNDILILK